MRVCREVASPQIACVGRRDGRCGVGSGRPPVTMRVPCGAAAGEKVGSRKERPLDDNPEERLPIAVTTRRAMRA
jgi:hypothetical protein